MNVPILVVDDEPINRLVIEEVLAAPGIDLVCVASGAEALRCLIEREFALVLLDVNMPGLDGFETAALIRSRPASAHTPIIFITAHSGDTARMLKAYETGAADYLLKPYEPIALKSKVGVFVELFRATEAKRRTTELEASNRQLEANLAENQRLASQLAHQASHDSLTGLPNRHLFEEILREALAMSQRAGRHAAVAFVDLDRFKFINDTFGHAAGDEVLQETARRLSAAVRISDVVARIGGDEFVVLLTDFVQWQESVLVAEKMLHLFAAPFTVNGYDVTLTPSIGIAVFPDDGDDGATLVKRADIAMYQAKQAGRNNFRYCTEAMSASAARQLALEKDLRSAVVAEDFVLHYQPKVELASGRIAGVEALLRWQRAADGVESASGFMGLAEETGFMLPIGEQVIGAVCRQARAWRDAGLPLCIAVNLSASELRGDRLLHIVRDALAAAALEPATIEFEVTEHASIFDNAESLSVLRRLREMGCRIALDNFGTGYASLALLTRFPFDSLKLDRSFVAGLPGNPQHAAIAEAVLTLARRLGLRTVAEGVGNAGQLHFLQDLGCDQIQGEWISLPLPADECEALIRSRQSISAPAIAAASSIQPGPASHA